MPFKSEAQRRKFYAMAARGEIPRSTVKEWEHETKAKNLPEKAGGKRAKSKKRGKAGNGRTKGIRKGKAR